MDHSQQPQDGRAAPGSPAPEQQPKEEQPDHIMDQPWEPEKQEGEPTEQQPVITIFEACSLNLTPSSNESEFLSLSLTASKINEKRKGQITNASSWRLTSALIIASLANVQQLLKGTLLELE